MMIGNIAAHFGALNSSSSALKLSGTAHNNTKASNSTKDLIDSLNQRKDDINKQKTEFRQNAIKQGKSQDEIDAKMKDYDGQIAKVNAQITQITQDKQQKAVEKAGEKSSANTKASSTKTDSQNFSDQAKAQQSQLIGLASAQAGTKSIDAVKFAKRVLKTEALVHAPSHAYAGEPEKAAQLNSTADSLTNKIAHLTKEMKESGKEAAESTPKTYEQAAAENYQRVADSADQSETENTINLLA